MLGGDRQRWLWLGFAMALGATLAIAPPAIANSWPPMAVPLFHLPLAATLSSFGLGFVGIVAVEAWTLRRHQALSWPHLSWPHLSWPYCVRLALGINLYSTLLGFAVVLLLILVPLIWTIPLAIAMPTLVALGLGWMTQGLSQWWRSRPCRPTWGLLLFTALWWGILVLVMALLWAIPTLNPATAAGRAFPDPTVPFYINVLQWGGVVAYFAVGFGLSLISEGFFLSRWCPRLPRSTLMKLIWVMNLRSYSYVAIPITILLLLRQS